MLFPFEPHPHQLDFLRVLLSALFDKESAMVEFPRGSGSTTCVVSGVLGWLRQRETLKINSSFPKVFVVCKSASSIPDVRRVGLTKVVQQIKKSVYTTSVCVLGTRDQLCVHPRLSDYSGKGERE